MKMVGHRTQSIYARYAIADEAMLQDRAAKLSALHVKEAEAARVVVPITAVRTRSGKVRAKSGEHNDLQAALKRRSHAGKAERRSTAVPATHDRY
jgi:hypothetical protein